MALVNVAEIVVLVAVFWVSYSYLAVLKKGGNEKPWGDLEVLYTQLERKSRSLFDKVSLLEGHSDKYFHSLHEAGLGELIAIRNALDKVSSDIRVLMKEDNYDGVNELIKFLRSPVAKVYPKLAAYTSADLRFLEDWEKRSDDLIISCVVKLGVMQSKNGESGISSVRRPTIHTLDELRKTLSETRVN